MKRAKKLFFAFFLLLLLIGTGMFFYVLLEGYSFAEAFYMTVITISTVGYTEVRELSTVGRIFTSFYILSSLSIFAYSLSVLTTYLFEGQLQNFIIV